MHVASYHATFKNHLFEDYLLTWENIHTVLKEKSKTQNYMSAHNFFLILSYIICI